ncbi:hypothetical protein [Corynebacterium flavescens]|uniref:hypothetical protein n=1 Tax=Corynebacterium flavescens TaxID=28028 RepID=UPI00257EC711|nr:MULTISPECIES: hypothetical protein [Corynebacterium]
MSEKTPAAQASSQQHAGAFDLRNVIGALLGLYGIILIACFFFLDPGINPDTGSLKEPADNLYSGLAMLAVAAIMMLWARLRPIIVDTSAAQDAAGDPAAASGAAANSNAGRD